MFKKSVVTVLMVLPISAFAHGHGGHGGMGDMSGHNFGGHGRAGNIGRAFSGHLFGGHFAERINADGGFAGLSKDSISVNDHPIADNTTRSISMKDDVVTKNIAYNSVNEQYSATTTIGKDGATRISTMDRDGVTRETSIAVSADMRSHSVAVTNGAETTMSIHSYDEGVGGLNVHACNDGVNTHGNVHAYNDVANAAYSAHVIHNDELTRIGYNVVSLTQRFHTVTVKDGDYTHVHTAGYIGSEDVGFSWNKGITRGGQYGFGYSVNSPGIAAIGNFGSTYYGEKAINLKTGEVKTITNYQPAPQPTPVVIRVTPAVVAHIVPASIAIPVTPSSDVTPTTTVYRDGYGDSATLYWNA